MSRDRVPTQVPRHNARRCEGARPWTCIARTRVAGPSPARTRRRGPRPSTAALTAGSAPSRLLRTGRCCAWRRSVYAFAGAPADVGAVACSPRPSAPAIGVVASHDTARCGCSGPGRRRTPDRPIEVSASRGTPDPPAGRSGAPQPRAVRRRPRAVRGGIPVHVAGAAGRRPERPPLVDELGRVVDDLQRRRLVRLAAGRTVRAPAAAWRPVDRWPPCARCSSCGGRATTLATATSSRGSSVRLHAAAVSRSHASRCGVGDRRAPLLPRPRLPRARCWPSRSTAGPSTGSSARVRP